jgi:hypothetical protein
MGLLMPLQTTRSCPHEHRPSTAVCLHCRRDARIAARLRRRHIALRASFLALVGASLIAGGTAAAIGLTDWRIPAVKDLLPASAIRVFRRINGTARAPIGLAAAPAPVPALTVPDVRATVDSEPVLEAVPKTAREAPATIPDTSLSPPTALPAPAPPRPLTPIVAEGRTRLKDSVVAFRTGDSVTVRFDTPRGRTRRPEKFEQIVRATLPAIYGPMADSFLVHVPAGGLIRAGSLMTDLPARGLHLSLGPGWDLALWPETRPGLTGPLIVMYKALVEKD